jgi:HlyD family secretion protein
MKVPLSVMLSVAGFLFAIYYIATNNKPDPKTIPVRPPIQKPVDHAISGTGIVESAEENVAVAPYQPGKVVRVFVTEGQTVKAGDPLYQLDSEELKLRVNSLSSTLKSQQIMLEKLRHEPRPEEVSPLKAALKQTEMNLNDLKTQLSRLENVTDVRAVSQDDVSRKQFAVAQAEAQREKSRADLQKVLAGAWTYDLQKAEADVLATRAQLQEAQAQLNHTVVKSPKAGKILKVYTRAGESVSAGSDLPPVLLGNTEMLQIRVDIDEVNASLATPNMRAVASLRGDASKKFDLAFKRIIPFMLPKKNLTGSNNERVDVRVLQMIYTFAPPAFPVYVGQQVDVFLYDDNKVNKSSIQ